MNTTDTKKFVCTIEFDTELARSHFVHFMNGHGEQTYWQWMQEQECETPEDITVNFKYDFENGVITTTLKKNRNYNG